MYNRTLDLVESVEALIRKFGYVDIVSTLEFIQALNKDTNTVSIGDVRTNVMYRITAEQYNRLREAARPESKIYTIKLFREMTGCGLKEAKDIIESNFYS